MIMNSAAVSLFILLYVNTIPLYMDNNNNNIIILYKLFNSKKYTIIHSSAFGCPIIITPP